MGIFRWLLFVGVVFWALLAAINFSAGDSARALSHGIAALAALCGLLTYKVWFKERP